MQGTVITNKGVQLLARLAASGETLTFTRAAVGTGRIPTGYDPAGMTGLNAYQMDGTICACSASEDTAAVVFQVSSIGVKTGFTITEAGLFAKGTDGEEILYAYLDMSTDPQYIYAEGGATSKFVEMTLNVVIGNASSVTAYINPGSLLTRDGDISETKIEKADIVETEFPSPSPGDTSKTFLGKMRKFVEDFKAFKTGIITVGRLANNGLTTAEGFALDARFGKILQDQIAQLNGELGNISGIASNKIITNGCERLKENWSSVQNGHFQISLPEYSDGSGGIVVFFGYKLREEYGSAMIICYGVARPAFIRLSSGNWSIPIYI